MKKTTKRDRMRKKNQLYIRSYIRLDEPTSTALDEICRHTFNTKGNLMRQYVRECVMRDSQRFAQETEQVLAATQHLKRV